MSTSARQSDYEIQRDLEEHIKDEGDPRERARLLIMLAMVRSIVDNVVAVREVIKELKAHREAFDEHIAEEQKLMNQGRGATRVAILFLAVAQVVVGYIFVEHVSTVKAIQAEVMDHAKRFAAIDERNRQEDRQK